jgi:ribosome maturation factor RimP
MNKVNSQLAGKLASLIQAMGYEYVGCEFLTQGRQTLLRIYIDTPSRVTVADCAKVNQQVGAMLAVENIIQGAYTLEVTSPGIDRPLFAMMDYQRFIGSQIKVRLYEPLNGRKQFKGLLKRVEGQKIYLFVEGNVDEIGLELPTIAKANLIGDVSFK